MFDRVHGKREIEIIAMVLMITILLSGCNFKMEKRESLDTKATNMLEEIIAALEKEDNEAVKNLFSEYALDQAEDIDSQIDELFEFYKGTMTSHDDGANDTAEGSGFNGSEDIISEVEGYYEVETSEDTYIIEFDYWVECMTKSREGLRNISIIQKSYFKQDENYKKFGTNNAGVFVVAEE